MSSIGVELKLSGSAEFKKQMSEATSQVKLFNAQIKGLSDTMTSNGSAFSRHQKITEALKGKLSALKAEAEALAKRIKEVSEASGEDSRAVTDLKTKMEYLQQTIKSTDEALKAQGGTLGAVGAEMEAVGNKLQSIGSKISSLGDTLTTRVTLPLVAAGTVATTKFAEVDKTMQLTNATMGNTTEQAKLLDSAMKSAAANSTFGMSDAATATLNFARAGLTAEQAAAALAPAMNLAAGEGGELDTVSAGLVATINGFHGSFEDASMYADVFANACNNSALDVNSLSNAMSVAAPIFSAAGYSVNDAALYMGVMANAGIDADTAANALKTGLARLVSPAKQGAEMMDRLGISVTNADGSMKDSVTIQSELHDAFSKLSESEQIAAASAIFGKNQMSNWLALINAAPSEVDELSEALAVEGTTMEMSEAMMSGFGGSLEKLKSSIDVAATSLGQALAPTILKVSDNIQKAVDWFNSLSEEQQQMIAQIGLIVAAIGPVLSIVGRVISSVGTFLTIGGSVLTHLGMFAGFITSTIIPAIGTLVTFITGSLLPALATIIVPLLPFIAIAAAVVAAGVLIYKNWDLIKQKAGELKDWLAEKFTAIGEGITQKWTEITEGLTMALETIKTTVTGALDGLKAKIEENGGGIQGIFATHMELYNQIWSDAFNLINEATGGKLGEVVNTISGKLDEIGNFFTELKDSALAWGQDLIQNFINGVLAKWEELKTTVSNVAQSVKDFLGFSEPKKGPLSNFHTYGPDMMKLYAEGIENSKYLVQNAVADVARDVSMLGNPGLDSDSIYSAVRQGSEDANISLSIGDREFQRYLRNIGVVFNA